MNDAGWILYMLAPSESLKWEIDPRVRVLCAAIRLDQGPRARHGTHGDLPDLRDGRHAVRRHDERVRADAWPLLELLHRRRQRGGRGRAHHYAWRPGSPRTRGGPWRRL